MKILKHLLVLSVVIVFTASCKNKPGLEVKTEANDTCKWSSFDYFYAKAYMIHDYDYSVAINNNEDITPYILKDKQWDLKTEDIEALNDIFCGRIKEESVDSSEADCFNPRHGIVFYNKQRKQVAHITICFECHQIKTIPKVGYMNEQALSEWCKKLGMPVFDREEEYYKYFKEHGH